MGVVEHPFDEKVYRVEFGKHGEVVPISELCHLWIGSQVCFWRRIIVWLVGWPLPGPVL